MKHRCLHAFCLGTLGWLFLSSAAREVNLTIDDADSSVLYDPTSAWLSCSACAGGTAFKGTYHSASFSPGDDDDDDGGGGRGRGKGGSGKDRKRRSLQRRAKGSDDDDDDDDDDDTPVEEPTMQLSFNGSGIHIFGFNGDVLGGAASTTVNLSFILDAERQDGNQFTRDLSQQAPSSNFAVFSRVNLPSSLHTLTIKLGMNSAFLFDYAIFTQNALDVVQSSTSASAIPQKSSSVLPQKSTNSIPHASNSATSSPTSSPPSCGSVSSHGPCLSSAPPSSKKIATFAGAVGGSVGVLGILALGIFISICTRRRRAARRERAEAEPRRMIGPAPFVPRYFPGTVVPTSPPPYTPSSPSSSNIAHASGSHLTYADVPPSTPPPSPTHELFLPPPPFAEAVADRNVRVPNPDTALTTSLVILPPRRPSRDIDI